MKGAFVAPGGSNKLLTPTECADVLQVPVKTLLRFRKRWELKSIKVGHAVRFRERDVEAWVKDHEEELSSTDSGISRARSRLVRS